MIHLSARLRRWLEAIPSTVLAVPLRPAVATVFWNSGMTKLANWDTAVALFADEYRLPLLPPELAADMAASIELSAPVLLVLGLLTRPAAAVLLGMTAVIEIFVYPQAWPTRSAGSLTRFSNDQRRADPMPGIRAFDLIRRGLSSVP
ncbi:DoxX family protein [Variovorax paradoxus]|nr:DoxX family protein [Variovorax paradoxus]MBT2305132.1 DoxX family protein [Variovorax paradoxus]